MQSVNQPLKGNSELIEESEDEESTSDDLEYESDDTIPTNKSFKLESDSLNLQDIKNRKKKLSYIQVCINFE